MTSVSSVSSSSTSSTLSTDWSALIEEAVTAKLAVKDTIEAKVSKNETKISAYQKAQSLLADIADAAYALSAPTGTLAKNTDLFNKRAAYLTANGFSDASSTVGVSVSNNTAVGTYDLTIDKIATAQKVATAGTFGSKTTALGYSGEFTLTIEGKTAATISVDATSTLADVASAINAQATTTGVKATILQTSTGSTPTYQLVLGATETGKAITAAFSSGTDDVLYDLGITTSTGTFANQLQAAQDSVIWLDGVKITRDSNEVTDALDGVTFYLYAPTDTGDSVSVEVNTDLSEVSSGIQALVDAYNAYRDFVVTQQAVTATGTAAADAVLFGDITLRTVNTQLMNALGSAVSQNTMALLGLELDSTNHLTLDTDTLNEALTTNIDAVKSLLTFNMTTSSDDLMLLSRGSDAPASFTLQFTFDGSGNVATAAVGGDASLFTVDDGVVTGVAGTAYEGFSFLYLGSSATVDVTVSYGLAEKLNVVADESSDTTDGAFQSLIDNLQDKNTKYASDISYVEERADALRTQLTNRYAKLQAAIAQAETMLSYLQAMLDAANSNN